MKKTRSDSADHKETVHMIHVYLRSVVVHNSGTVVVLYFQCECVMADSQLGMHEGPKRESIIPSTDYSYTDMYKS